MGMICVEDKPMTTKLDHLILSVNDLDASVQFYTEILGFRDEGEREPFRLIRIAPDCLIQLAPWTTPGGKHLAFAMTREEFDAAFQRLRDAAIPYGDAFDAAANMSGPGVADGALGPTTSLYCMDPNQHLIEILHYEG
jgi:catechol 2,3-dioxygenase-like lactoylglutathione lyase family enzyme